MIFKNKKEKNKLLPKQVSFNIINKKKKTNKKLHECITTASMMRFFIKKKKHIKII